MENFFKNLSKEEKQSEILGFICPILFYPFYKKWIFF